MKEFYSDNINPGEVLNAILLRKKSIFFIVLTFTLLGLIYSMSLEDRYTSSSILQGTSSTGTQSSVLQQFSGLASIAGVNLGSGSSSIDPVITAIEKIKSRDFLKHLLSFDGVKENLGAVVGYDHSSKQILYNLDEFNPNTKKWIRKISSKYQLSEPSHLELFDDYLSTIKIGRDSETSLINISVEHFSPIFAHEFLSLIINEINEITRLQDLQNAERSIKYLESKLSQTELREIKVTLNQLITEELRKLMLTNVSSSYILEAIDSPFIPEKKSSPNRLLILISFIIMGLFTSILYSLIKGLTDKDISLMKSHQ